MMFSWGQASHIPRFFILTSYPTVTVLCHTCLTQVDPLTLCRHRLFLEFGLAVAFLPSELEMDHEFEVSQSIVLLSDVPRGSLHFGVGGASCSISSYEN